MSQTTISVVIVNYNAGPLLVDCVRSVFNSSLPTNVRLSVYLSDNGSVDGSVELLETAFNANPALHIYRNHQNLGFAKANNRVLTDVTSDYLLFLNPDSLLKPDTLERMLAFMDKSPQVGMAGCRVKNADGSEQRGCRRFIPTPVRAMQRVLHVDKLLSSDKLQGFDLTNQPLPSAPVEVEAISGSFMFVRRSAMQDVGLMDEHYFLHCEDLDWCLRFTQRGWKIMFVPDVEVEHRQGSCSQSTPVRVEWYKHRGMVYFYHKFFKKEHSIFMIWLVSASVYARFALKSVVLGLKGILSK